MNRSRVLIGSLLGSPVLPRAIFLLVASAVAALIGTLSLSRHIHVDEFHNVFSMQLVGAWRLADYADPAELYHVIFSLLTRHFTSTRDMFLVLRAISGGLFLGLLIAIACVQPFFETTWGRLAVFVGVATWWPAWRHGFEIRHDLVLAFGVVGLYALVLRAARAGQTARPPLLAGSIAALMQLNSHKAVLLWAPCALLLVLLRWRDGRREASRCLGWFILGSSAGLAVGLGVLCLGNALDAYVTQLAHFTRYAADAESFTPIPVFLYLATTGPLLSACAVVLVGITGVKLVQRAMPIQQVLTVAFAASAVLALAVNPQPFPYNIVWMTPALAFAGIGGAHCVLARAGRFQPLVGAALLVLPALQFVTQLSTDDYLTRTWTKQLNVIDAAEALTAPGDPVFDGVGMVCTRPPATRDWLIHSLFMSEYKQGRREQLRDVIAREVPPVIIRGHYRFNWLPGADVAAVDAKYVPLSRQVWVLGTQTTGPEQEIQIERAGRYLVQARLATASMLTLDGVTVAPSTVLQLARGPHRVAGPDGVSVIWLGPHLAAFPPGLDVPGTLFAAARLPGQ